jgi:tRNA (guanine10-N2)-dimethyltransferase
MKFLAILGRQPELGLVELESLLGAVKRFGGHAIFDQPVDINRLGGALKVARILDRQVWKGFDHIQFDISSIPRPDGKTNFAVSYYGPWPAGRKLEAFGLTLKKQLAGSYRLVLPKPGSDALTAPQLKFNHIPQPGFELVVAVDGKKAVIALTEQIQDVDWYSQRDYDRPARDPKVGMLPPKLAQILVNLVPEGKVYDPFCGTGIILQEALLMGRPAAGSDLSDKMAQATKTNLRWLQQQVDHPLPDWTVAQADATSVKVPVGSSIVSEGYLGFSKQESGLDELYREFLINMQQLASGSRLAICVPIWSNDTLGVVDQLPDLGYTVKRFAAYSGDLVYRRPDQSVGRKILALRRSSG